MPEPRDLLLILDAAPISSDLERHYRITQKVSPRVIIVEAAGASAKKELQTMEGVEAVLERGQRPAQEIRGALSDAELVFVDAYAQAPAVSKRRPGEGLDWDAAGFLPP